MSILSFLQECIDKNIFVVECSDHVISQAYETAICDFILKRCIGCQKKYLTAEGVDYNVVLQDLKSCSLFEKKLYILNAENFPIAKIDNTKNSLILHCKKFDKRSANSQKIAHIKLDKRYDILRDIIKYFCDKKCISLDFSSLANFAEYIYNNDFSIESEVEKLLLYFGDKANIQLKDLTAYLSYSYKAINLLYRSIIFSDYVAFFKNLKIVEQQNFMLIISVGLKYFNFILDSVEKAKLGIKTTKEEMIKNNFYDYKSLDYALGKKLSPNCIKSIIYQFLCIEAKCKQNFIPKDLLIINFLQEIFFVLKNIKIDS